MHPAVINVSLRREIKSLVEYGYVVEVLTRGGQIVPFEISVTLHHDLKMGTIHDTDEPMLENASYASLWDIYEVIEEIKKEMYTETGYEMKDYLLKYVKMPVKEEIEWDLNPIIELALATHDIRWCEKIHSSVRSYKTKS